MASPTIFMVLNQAGLSEDMKVLQHGRHGHGKGFRELRECGFSFGQHFQHAPAGGIAERAEN